MGEEAVRAPIVGETSVAKVTQYVAAGDRPDAFRYFLVLETEAGHIVTEGLPSGSVAWEEHCANLGDRCAQARVIGSLDCRFAGITVKDVRRFMAAQGVKPSQA